MGRRYVTNKWPNLTVRHCQFKNGLFIASSEEEEKLIEGLDYFGVHVFLQDEPTVRNAPAVAEGTSEDAPIAPVVPEAVRSGRRGTRSV